MIPIFSEQQVLQQLKSKTNPFFEEYYAFYSSWLGGIVTDPHLMGLPIDDHMVHRGDGVFEAMKAVNRRVYQMEPHLDRLFRSAEKIAIKSPFTRDEMKDIILETLKVANREDVTIRLYLSRGPGNFSVNPYDSVGAQVYVVITKLVPPVAEKYEKGVRIGKSEIPVKTSWMAQVKSCNYLPNVMMKKEAVDRNLDFVVCFEEGFVTESATENIMIVSQAGVIVHPQFDVILRGTTMLRACELARENGMRTKIKPISMDDLLTAKEVMIAGTSLNILPVVAFEGQTIGNGHPGPVAQKLNGWMQEDIQLGQTY